MGNERWNWYGADEAVKDGQRGARWAFLNRVLDVTEAERGQEAWRKQMMRQYLTERAAEMDTHLLACSWCGRKNDPRDPHLITLTVDDCRILQFCNSCERYSPVDS